MFSARGLALKMFPISRLPVKPFRHCHTDIAESAVMTKRMFMREFFPRFAASFIAGGMLSFTIFRYVGINDHRSEEHYRVACNKIDDLADKMISTQLQDVRILNDAVYRICGVPMSVVIANRENYIKYTKELMEFYSKAVTAGSKDQTLQTELDAISTIYANYQKLHMNLMQMSPDQRKHYNNRMTVPEGDQNVLVTAMAPTSIAYLCVVLPAEFAHFNQLHMHVTGPALIRVAEMCSEHLLANRQVDYAPSKEDYECCVSTKETCPVCFPGVKAKIDSTKITTNAKP